MKKYLEEEYIKKKNYFPAYICSCGRCYFIKDSLPVEIKDCECGMKIGGKNEILVERENHFAIYFDEKQKNYIENGRANKIINKCKLKGKLLNDYKKEFITGPIISHLPKLSDLLLKNDVINDKNFAKIFVNFIFLSQIYIESKIDEKLEEFDNIDLLERINDLNTKLEKYLGIKNLNYANFMNYFCDIYCKSLKSNDDYYKNKDKLYGFINNLLKNELTDQTLKNIEMNILTTLAYQPDFRGEDLKYLLTGAKYPNKMQLENYLSLYTKKPLPMLNALIKNNKQNSDISKLSHIEIINDFVNAFAEEKNNLITRKESEIIRIDDYLIESKEKAYDNDEKFILEIQFDKFCESYEQIAIEPPFQITKEQIVKNILNDDKISTKKTAINKLYSHLIGIQNELLKTIFDYYYSCKEKLKEDIIIKNAIEQIQKEIPIQHATNENIFSFNISNNIILSFEEFFSFYSSRNIFNDKEDKIDYSKYSEIKFKINTIEKELINNILIGKKKLFSKRQITYKFYLDPYEEEEKAQGFKKFMKYMEKKLLQK